MGPRRNLPMIWPIMTHTSYYTLIGESKSDWTAGTELKRMSLIDVGNRRVAPLYQRISSTTDLEPSSEEILRPCQLWWLSLAVVLVGAAPIIRRREHAAIMAWHQLLEFLRTSLKSQRFETPKFCFCFFIIPWRIALTPHFCALLNVSSYQVSICMPLSLLSCFLLVY